MKYTTRQAEVMANLDRVTTDGSRHDPMFWLGEKNVSRQVRSLRAYGCIELRDGRLVEVESPAVIPRQAALDTDAAVKAMRVLLGEDTENGDETGRSQSTTKALRP